MEATRKELRESLKETANLELKEFPKDTPGGSGSKETPGGIGLKERKKIEMKYK